MKEHIGNVSDHNFVRLKYEEYPSNVGKILTKITFYEHNLPILLINYGHVSYGGTYLHYKQPYSWSVLLILKTVSLRQTNVYIFGKLKIQANYPCIFQYNIQGDLEVIQGDTIKFQIKMCVN